MVQAFKWDERTVAERRRDETLGEFLRAAQQWVNFYKTTRPHEGLDYRSPDQCTRNTACLTFHQFPYFNVSDFGYWPVLLSLRCRTRGKLEIFRPAMTFIDMLFVLLPGLSHYVG